VLFANAVGEQNCTACATNVIVYQHRRGRLMGYSVKHVTMTTLEQKIPGTVTIALLRSPRAKLRSAITSAINANGVWLCATAVSL